MIKKLNSDKRYLGITSPITQRPFIGSRREGWETYAMA